MKALDDVIMTLESGHIPANDTITDMVKELGGDPFAVQALNVYGNEVASFCHILYMICLTVRKLRQEAIEE